MQTRHIRPPRCVSRSRASWPFVVACQRTRVREWWVGVWTPAALDQGVRLVAAARGHVPGGVVVKGVMVMRCPQPTMNRPVIVNVLLWHLRRSARQASLLQGREVLR